MTDHPRGVRMWLGSFGMVLVACGTGDDGEPIVVGEPPVTVHVSTLGDDANDGIDHPVETLRRALAIATENRRVAEILLGPGSYTIGFGERFPYAVPSGVRITGPADGGAVLGGSGTGTGLMFSTGVLRNVELDSFGVAIEASAMLQIENVRVADSTVAVSVGAEAKLQIDGLEIDGSPPAPCPVGIQLGSGGQLVAERLNTTELGIALDAPGNATVDIAHALFLGRVPGAGCRRPALAAVNLHSFKLSDVTIERGAIGIQLSGGAPAAGAQATITTTTLQHLSTIGFDGVDGTWSLMQVTIANNDGTAIRIAGSSGIRPASLSMRGSRILGNVGDGLMLLDNATADLGTAASPGGNVLQSNTGVGLNIVGPSGAHEVAAAGNTWRPLVQGADALGNYPSTETVTGPIAPVPGNNFAVATGWSLVP